MRLYIYFALLLVLSGCMQTAFIGTATTVATSVQEERGFGGVWDDTKIRTKINAAWLSEQPALLTKVELSVREGRVLLTGSVDTPEEQIEAVRLAWSVDGVREVFDEIKVGEGGGIWGYTKDALVTTELRADLMFDNNISSINYSLKTVNGIVYLMGVAQDQEELDRVIKHASKNGNVKKVVSYVRMKGEPLPTQDQAASSSSDIDPQSQLKIQEQEAIEVQELDSPNTGSSFQ